MISENYIPLTVSIFLKEWNLEFDFYSLGGYCSQRHRVIFSAVNNIFYLGCFKFAYKNMKNFVLNFFTASAYRDVSLNRLNKGSVIKEELSSMYVFVGVCLCPSTVETSTVCIGVVEMLDCTKQQPYFKWA